MKSIMSLIFILVLNITFGQTKLNIWNPQKRTNQTLTQINAKNPPKSFESQLPDGTSDVYDFVKTNPIKVETPKNKLSFRPMIYKSRKSFSFVSYEPSKGWVGFYNGKDNQNYILSSNTVSKDTVSILDNLCGGMDINIPNKKPQRQLTKKPRAEKTGNSDFYNRYVPINKSCKVYAEVTNDLHNYLGNDLTTSMMYISNIFAGVSYVFAREGIHLYLNKVYVWTEVDPFGYTTLETSLQSIVAFRANIATFTPTDPESHFKCLVTNGRYGGIAGRSATPNGYINPSPIIPYEASISVNGLCRNNFCAQSPSNPNTNISTFNFPIKLLCHELGHNFGSSHTQTCLWYNEDGNPLGVLDSCYKEPFPGPPTCYITSWYPIKKAAIPTIMSYCSHLGFDDNELLNGFGKYPRWSIKSTLQLTSDLPENSIGNIPFVKTLFHDSVTANSVILGGSLGSVESDLLVRGFCLSTEPEPTVYNSVVLNESFAQEFNSKITSLNSSTTYYYRAFATTPKGIGYGAIYQFNTLDASAPTISTKMPSGITNSTALSGGFNINDNGSTILGKGICYSSTNSEPNVIDTDVSVIEIPGNNQDFEIGMTNLLSSNFYYVRAWARNETGIGYGDVQLFLTNTSDKILFSDIDTIKINTVNATLEVTIASDGGSPITEKGFCYKTTAQVDESGPPTVGNQKTMDGDSLGTFRSQLKFLTPNTSYTARAYARNSTELRYSSPIAFTTKKAPLFKIESITQTVSSKMDVTIEITQGSSYQTLGIIASKTNQNPTISNYSNIFVGINCYPQNPGCIVPREQLYNLTNITLGQGTYFVRAYLIDNNGNYFYSQNVETVNFTCTTNASLEGIDNQSSNNNVIFPTSMYILGNFSNSCSYNIEDWGFIWDESPSVPTIESNNKLSFGSNGNVSGFIDGGLITGLNPNTNYFVRSYIITSAGLYLSNPALIRTKVANLPTLGIRATEVTNESAQFGIKIFDDGGSEIDSIGIIWSTNPNVTLSNVLPGNKIMVPCVPASRTLSEVFISTVGNAVLANNTTYYFKAFAFNDLGLSYSNFSPGTSFKDSYNNNVNVTKIFFPEYFPQSTARITTYNAPINTSDVTSITHNSAICGGSVFSSIQGEVLERGVVWSEQPNPTVDLSTKTEQGPGFGEFISDVSPLEPEKQYFVRAYAKTTNGYLYGTTKFFTTLSVSPKLILKSISNITTNSVTLKAKIINKGDGYIYQKGFAYKDANQTGPVFTYVDCGGNCTEIGDTTFSLVLTGLDPGKNYVAKPYVLSFCSASQPNTLCPDGCCIGSSDDVWNFQTLFNPPTVTTGPQNYLGWTDVGLIGTPPQISYSEISGNIVSTGGQPILERGFVWSQCNQNPTLDALSPCTVSIGNYATSTKSASIPLTGPFSYSTVTPSKVLYAPPPNLNIVYPTGLSWWVRAYARSSAGLSYGNVLEAKTNFLPHFRKNVGPTGSLLNVGSVFPLKAYTKHDVIGKATLGWGLFQFTGCTMKWGNVYSLTPNPTIENQGTNGGITVNNVIGGPGGAQEYTPDFRIENLLENQQYYCRYYIQTKNQLNQSFIIYSDEYQFRTLGNQDFNDANCNVEKTLNVYQNGSEWYYRFGLQGQCSKYKIELLKFPSDPSGDPNAQFEYTVPLIAEYKPTYNEVSFGTVTKSMTPQPQNLPQGTNSWWGIAVTCDCYESPNSENRTVRAYFFVP